MLLARNVTGKNYHYGLKTSQDGVRDFKWDWNGQKCRWQVKLSSFCLYQRIVTGGKVNTRKLFFYYSSKWKLYIHTYIYLHALNEYKHYWKHLDMGMTQALHWLDLIFNCSTKVSSLHKWWILYFLKKKKSLTTILWVVYHAWYKDAPQLLIL